VQRRGAGLERLGLCAAIELHGVFHLSALRLAPVVLQQEGPDPPAVGGLEQPLVLAGDHDDIVPIGVGRAHRGDDLEADRHRRDVRRRLDRGAVLGRRDVLPEHLDPVRIEQDLGAGRELALEDHFTGLARRQAGRGHQSDLRRRILGVQRLPVVDPQPVPLRLGLGDDRPALLLKLRQCPPGKPEHQSQAHQGQGHLANQTATHTGPPELASGAACRVTACGSFGAVGKDKIASHTMLR